MAQVAMQSSTCLEKTLYSWKCPGTRNVPKHVEDMRQSALTTSTFMVPVGISHPTQNLISWLSWNGVAVKIINALEIKLDSNFESQCNYTRLFQCRSSEIPLFAFGCFVGKVDHHGLHHRPHLLAKQCG